MKTIAKTKAEHFDVHLVLDYHPRDKKPNILYLDLTDFSFDCINGQDSCDICKIENHCEVPNAGDADEDDQYQEDIDHTKDLVQKYFPDYKNTYPEYFI